MYYLYDSKHLKPIRISPQNAIAIAQFVDGILVTNDIEEAVFIASYPKSAFLLHPKNSSSLFSFWRYQLRYRTCAEFRIILYAAPKNTLYRLLSWVASLSFGTYSLILFPRRKR